MKSEISLDDLIQQRLIMSEIGDFSTLDPKEQTQERARYWLDVKLGMLSGSSGRAAKYFLQIPTHLRTYAVNDVLVRRYPINLVLVDHQVEGYSSLIITALRGSPSPAILDLVHPECRSQEMIKRLIAERKSSQLMKILIDCEWVMENMTPELIEFACTQSFEFALNADRLILTDSALAALATHQINGYNKIRDEGRFDLLVKPISQGYWPKSNLVTGDLSKPQGLANGFRFLLSAQSEDEEALYMAYMMTFPIEKVVKVLSGPRGGRFLLEMYTAEQLKPYLKEMSMLVRGKILESELGM